MTLASNGNGLLRGKQGELGLASPETGSESRHVSILTEKSIVNVQLCQLLPNLTVSFIRLRAISLSALPSAPEATLGDFLTSFPTHDSGTPS